MSKYNRHNLHELLQRKDLIVRDTDKNQGTSIMERVDYIHEMLSSHLMKYSNYELIPTNKHDTALLQRNIKFLQLFATYRMELIQEGKIYFERALDPPKTPTYESHPGIWTPKSP